MAGGLREGLIRLTKWPFIGIILAIRRYLPTPPIEKARFLRRMSADSQPPWPPHLAPGPNINATKSLGLKGKV